jgi:FkbM family methyltransferase
MKKRYLWLLVPAALACVRFVPKMVAGPEWRTETYFAMQRGWMAHWPFESGKYAPRVLLPAVRPVTPVWFQVDPHIKMQLDPEDFVSRTILETGEWEPTSWQAMRAHLEGGATFVDVGAQIGYYSLKAAHVVGPRGHVIAIEPNPETVSKLQANIQASGASVIAVQPVACSDAEAMLDLFAAPEANTGETSLSMANASQTGAAVHTYKVRARPLDDIVKESGVARVDVIKIDVEGAETLVLKGSQETLARFHPILMVEIIDRQLRQMGSSAAELTDFLRAQGYTARHATGDNVEFGFGAATASR